MRISDWSSDVCSSDLDADSRASADTDVPDGSAVACRLAVEVGRARPWHQSTISRSASVLDGSTGPAVITILPSGATSIRATGTPAARAALMARVTSVCRKVDGPRDMARSEEHTSELQSLMRISYAVFRLKKKKHHTSTV